MMHSNVQKPDPNEYVDPNGIRWRLIPGAARYFAGSNGQIKSFAGHKEGIILTPCLINSGYLSVRITDWKKNAEVHRLIAMAFIDNPDNLPQVNHIDGNKTNNTVENLEWCDYEYNVAHAVENSLYRPKRGEESGNAILTENTVRKIYLEYRINHTPISTIAEIYNINMSTVRSVIYKNAWKHVTDLLDEEHGLKPLGGEAHEYMTEAEASEIYLMHKLNHTPVTEIHEIFPQYSISAIQGVMYKETWTKVTDKMDAKYGFSTEKVIRPMDESLVKDIYLDLKVNGLTSKDVQKKYNIAAGTVSNILYKHRWANYTDKLDDQYGIPAYERKQNPNLDEDTVRECYKLMLDGYTTRQVSNMKNISNDVLRMIKKKKSWKKFTDQIDAELLLNR